MKGKRILLGITGGIAAYKTTFLIRLFKKAGAEVKVIMTPASSDFVSPLVLATLSENPVVIEFWNKQTGQWTNHVDLALWADVYLVAPLTANSLSKLANGACDNMVLATYLSAKCPVFLAPAMDLDMYAHPTTKSNLNLVQANGNYLIPAEHGELASGLVGTGRMAEPETIFNYLYSHFNAGSNDLDGKVFLITAGPTYEAIDPVRFIGNHSTGKMGFELAKQVAARGGKVVLITGPTSLASSHPNIELIRITDAREMLRQVQMIWDSVDVGIFAAAVADYRPKIQAEEKIKKSNENLTLELVKNPDILKWAGENKKEEQLLVGFALETNNLIENAKNKLVKKNLDLIVANSLEDEGAGFAYDTNKVTLLDRHNNRTDLELSSKENIACEIINLLSLYLK